MTRPDVESVAVLAVGTLAQRQLAAPKNRDKGIPAESARELALLMLAEVGEVLDALDALERGGTVADVYAELGDVAAFVGLVAWRVMGDEKTT